MRSFRWIICALLLFISATAIANEPIQTQIIHEEMAIQPGRPFTVALKFSLDETWHVYWKNPGDTGMPIQIEWTLPEGFTVGSIEWPFPNRYAMDTLITYGYEKEVILLAQITPPEQLSTKEIPINANLKWVACSDSMCLPGQANVAITLPVQQETPTRRLESQIVIGTAKAKVPVKHDTITARKNGDLIEVHLPNTIEVSEHVYFCPEEAGIIAQEIEAVVAKTNDHHLVVLKAGENFSSELQGVLVFQHPDGSSQAIEIATNVADDAVELDPITMAALTPIIHPIANSTTDEFWIAFAFAFIGGIILNLMPCVLPVVSLKILSFVKLAGENRFQIFKHGLAYSIGVLLSFWLIAGILIALQAYGNAIGWGFQLQNPLFVAFLIAIIFVFSMSLFGVFEMGTSMINIASKAQGKSEGLSNAFLSGILATAVATPCTGPFMGTAVGIATTLSAPLAMLVFTSLGFGMAFPYLLLSIFPQFLRLLPKPGNWMITFKEFAGFFMIGTILWFIWVFAAQTSTVSIIILLASLFFLAIGCWVLGKWGTPIQNRSTRILGRMLAIALFALATSTIYIATEYIESDQHIVATSDWESFSPQRIEELRAAGTPVFVDFTARWCLVCQANHLVLTTQQVEALFNEKGVVKMKADWTSHDAVITEALRKFGRNGVPLYVYYPVEGEPIILPQLLTPEIVISSIQENTNNDTAL